MTFMLLALHKNEETDHKPTGSAGYSFERKKKPKSPNERVLQHEPKRSTVDETAGPIAREHPQRPGEDFGSA